MVNNKIPPASVHRGVNIYGAHIKLETLIWQGGDWGRGGRYMAP